MLKKKIDKIIAMLLTIAMIIGFTPVPAYAAETGQTYVIRSAANNSLVIAEDTAEEGANVLLEEYQADDDGQKWTMVKCDDGNVQFVNVESGFVLDLGGYGDVYVGLNSIVWENNACITEYWKLESIGDKYLIRCKANPSLALDANANANTIRPGTTLQLWNDNYDSTQIWILDAIDDTTTNSQGRNSTPGSNISVSTSDIYIEANRNNIPIRTEASSNASVAMRLEKGSVVRITGSVQSKANNTWYIVNYGNQNYYVFSGNVKQHMHSFQASNDAPGVSLCSCGYYTYSPTGATNTSAVATSGWLLGEDIIAAATTAGITSLAEGAAVAFPYIAIAVIGGTVVYIAYNATFTRAYFSDKVKTMEAFDLGAPETGKYYYAMTENTADSPLLVCYACPLDQDTALDFLICKVTARDILKGVAISGIYTYKYEDAFKLAERYSQIRTVEGFFDYGDSNGSKVTEWDKDASGNFAEGHFNHFHLSYNPNNRVWKKKNVHIWYGTPYTNAYLPAAA